MSDTQHTPTAQCRRCHGRVLDAFLCRHCLTTINRELAELPWWQRRLTEAALGQVRMGDNAGRKSAPRRGIDGDKTLAACIEQLPDDDDLDKARRARQKSALRHALATGGVNARASELLAEIADGLGFWCRVLCEERGIDYTTPVIRNRPTAHGQAHAEWLRANLRAIAASESAGEIADDILGRDRKRRGLIEQIVDAVNRPVETLLLGDCPTWDENLQRECGRPLRAPMGSVEAYCKRCKRTHNVALLQLDNGKRFESKPHTFAEIKRYNASQPAEFRVPLRTLQHWRHTEQLTIRGWLRPDGHRGISRHSDDDQPLYLWTDVQKLIIAKPQKLNTGASAHTASR